MVEEGAILIASRIMAALTMITAIALETDKGNFEVVLGIIILFLLLLIMIQDGRILPGRPAPVSTKAYAITREKQPSDPYPRIQFAPPQRAAASDRFGFPC